MTSGMLFEVAQQIKSQDMELQGNVEYAITLIFIQ